MYYSYLLFDLDGTITESGPGIMNSVRYTLKKMGFAELPSGTLEKFVGPPLADSFMKYAGMSQEEATQAISCYREYYTSKGIFENSVYPGVEEMLQKLKENGFVLALSTSKPELFAKKILEHFQINQYFSAICGASMDEKRVAKAEVIRYTLDTLKLSESQKGEILMVGDREHDVFGAKENGLDCLGVLYGYGDREELEQAGAKYIADTASDVADILINMHSQ